MDERVIPDSMQTTYDRFHFAPAVRVGDILLCSGQIGAGEDGRCPDDPAAEFRLAFEAVGTVLAEAGADFSNIVEMTTFHVGMDELGAFMKVKDAFMGEPHAAWTAIGCTALAIPGARVEIKVQAHLS